MSLIASNNKKVNPLYEDSLNDGAKDLLASLARALGGQVSGSAISAPGPGHSAHDRSLSVTPCATAPSGFLVHSFAGDDPLVCIDYVRARLGLSPVRPGQASKVAAQRERKSAGEARQASDN